jgi:hypothetical protein
VSKNQLGFGEIDDWEVVDERALKVRVGDREHMFDVMSKAQGQDIKSVMQVYTESALRNSRYAEAIKDHSVSGKDLLAFVTGEYVEILERDLNRGWARGRRYKEKGAGWFPMECVKPVFRLPLNLDYRLEQLRKKKEEEKEQEREKQLEKELEVADDRYSIMSWGKENFRKGPDGSSGGSKSPTGSTGNLSIRGTLSRGTLSKAMKKTNSEVAEWGWRDLVLQVKFSKVSFVFY